MRKHGEILVVLLSCLLLLPVAAQAQDDRQNGIIAYVGADFNIYLLDPESNVPSQLTSDAGDMRRYQWPTWSTDGRLAFFSTYIEDGNFFLGAHIAQEGAAPARQVYAGRNEAFNYAYWSPQDCAPAADCRNLTMLISSREKGMFLELLRVTPDDASSETVGLGGPPFYYSWSPDGRRMLWQRRNETFDIYDVAGAQVTETLKQTPGTIFAPAWSPVDDRLLFGMREDDTDLTDLVIVGHNEEVFTLAPGLEGLVSFSWSPDGNYVAYRVATSGSVGPVFVVDALTGEVVARTPIAGVFAFFWSPDSQKIAYITLATTPGSFSARSGRAGVLAAPVTQQTAGISWSVLKVAEESVTRFGSFIPTREMVYIIQYFDQFAQSHRVWSPDSRHLVYSEMTEGGPLVNLLDVTLVDNVPFSIARGVIGIWSFT